VESHWNWAEDARTNLPVEVYSNCKAVELFLNGKPLGVKKPEDAPDRILRWNVAFQPGELKAVGWRDGKTVEYGLATAGKAARMELAPDRTKLRANGEDAASIELRLVDGKGVLVPNGDALCTVQVRGAGRLLAVDNGNQSDTTPLRSPARQLNRGRALAVVQSLAHESGEILVTVTAPGLPEARLRLQSR
jgi:beta-galactosidase